MKKEENKVAQSAQVNNEKENAVKQIESIAETSLNLQKELERKQQELEKTLKELERKQELNKRRVIFINAVSKIEETKNELIEEKSNFESLDIALNVTKGNYNREAIFNIKNPEILIEIFDFLKNKISKKVEEIEIELVK